MRSKLIPLIGAVTIMLVAFSNKAQAENLRESREEFRIVFVDQIGSKGLKAYIRSISTKNQVSSLQQEIAADPPLIRRLRAHGIQIRNIIRRERTPNGRTIFYLR